MTRSISATSTGHLGEADDHVPESAPSTPKSPQPAEHDSFARSIKTDAHLDLLAKLPVSLRGHANTLREAAAHLEESTTCAVTLAPFDKPVRLSPCGHMFSQGVAARLSVCALCRRSIHQCFDAPLMGVLAGQVQAYLPGGAETAPESHIEKLFSEIIKTPELMDNADDLAAYAPHKIASETQGTPADLHRDSTESSSTAQSSETTASFEETPHLTALRAAARSPETAEAAMEDLSQQPNLPVAFMLSVLRTHLFNGTPAAQAAAWRAVQTLSRAMSSPVLLDRCWELPEAESYRRSVPGDLNNAQQDDLARAHIQMLFDFPNLSRHAVTGAIASALNAADPSIKLQLVNLPEAHDRLYDGGKVLKILLRKGPSYPQKELLKMIRQSGGPAFFMRHFPNSLSQDTFRQAWQLLRRSS